MKKDVRWEFAAFVYAILLVKVSFYSIVLMNVYFNRYDKSSNFSYKWHPVFLLWEKRMEFVYVFFTAILMIYLFNPFDPKLYYIDMDIIITFFLFGVVLITRADWDYFVQDTNLCHQIGLC